MMRQGAHPGSLQDIVDSNSQIRFSNRYATLFLGSWELLESSFFGFPRYLRWRSMQGWRGDPLDHFTEHPALADLFG